MKLKVAGGLLLCLAFSLALIICARPERRAHVGGPQQCGDVEHNAKTPLQALGVIAVPGLPLASTDIAWADPGTERFYFADRTNGGVDIIDAENDIYVNRVLGFAGAHGANG